MRKQYIFDGWTVTDSAFDGVLSAKVPGCLHTDLINAGIIKDIFYRDNNSKYQWVENCSPIYETQFDADVSDNVTLKFEGIDTYADVYLNGKHLGEVHNMFIPHAFDVSGILEEKDNILRVEFASPVKAVEGMAESSEYAFTGDRINARRIQCTYGWDWVDRFVTMGIFRPVYLEYREGIEIEDVYIRTDLIDSFGAALTAEYTFSGYAGGGLAQAEILSPSGESVYSDVFYADRELTVRKIDIKAPELWYPSGYGEQPLYTLKVSAGNSAYETKFGIRTLRIINHRDDVGSEYYDKALLTSRESLAGRSRTLDDRFFGFEVIVNGKRIFCRGGNWVPCDPFPSEHSDGKISSLVISAKEMGVNILRVWGGGMFEKRAFLDECDRQGILVCQDFLMACGRYPEKEKWFINELLLESEYAVKYMRNHPCLAWFHGDNENAVDGSDLLPDYMGRSSALDGIFPSIYKYSKNIPFLLSSPWGGNKFSSITAGTSHNTNFIGEIFEYFCRTDGSDYKEYLAQFTSRFVSEDPTFGAVCRESMLDFMTEDDLLGDDESILLYHTKTNPALPKEIYAYVRAFSEKVLGSFKDGEDKYFKLKYIQCEWVRITYELVLRNLGYSNGIIYWMFNDCWPASLGWAFVDYYKRRKPSYYAFKRISNHIAGSFEVDGGGFVISNTSDSEKEAHVMLRALDKNDGYKVLDTVDITLMLGAYSSERIDTSLLCRDGAVLVSDVISGGECYRSYCKRGNLHIRETDQFTVSDAGENSITIEAKDYLQAVELEGDLDFSDNYFTMLPGEKKAVSFERRASYQGAPTVKAYTLM